MGQQARYRQQEWDAAAQDDKERKAIAKNAGRTAISRKALSVPARWLLKKELIRGSILDYGCGKGGDTKRLFEMNKMIIGYDLHHTHDARWYTDEYNMVKYKYDTILCTYVLNVVQKWDANFLIDKIKDMLHPRGTAYITVRRDIKTEGVNSRGTYQRNVTLKLPVVRETSTYCIYKMEK